MLRDMPVRDEIREFLFKTWAEVLALSAVRDGPQHADTITLKRTAADLVWAASAKPNRSDRAQVIQNLPGLLQRLRQGLALMGVNGAPQDAQIKIADRHPGRCLPVQDRCPSRRPTSTPWPSAWPIWRTFISDATLGDMPLNADNIEMMLGIDASSIHVVADNGAPVDDAMVAWAQELQAGHLVHAGPQRRIGPGAVRLAKPAQATAPVRSGGWQQLPDPAAPPGRVPAGRSCWWRRMRKA